MKNLWLAVALLFVMAMQSESAKAQTQVKFHWGFKGGLNLTTFDSDADDFQARMGQWGALCRWNIGENFAIQPELFYSRMGARAIRKTLYWNKGEKPFGRDYFAPGKNHSDEEGFRLKVISDNIQLPIIFKYYLPIQKFEHGLNLHAGPLFSQQLDYTISSPSPHSFIYDPGISDSNDKVSFVESMRTFARAMNKFTVHAVVGLGYDSPTGIGVDFRWQTGITPVWDADHIGCYNRHSHDRVWAFCFSYTF